uniref:BEACH domain-containing protein n=1 Tax=Fagus sylvatica TaxID=28930 RepID=A0A2N9EIF4_FAGSY
MDEEMCFECLQRRINSDFSDRLVFSYGLSHSALPLGSSAIVQMCKPSGESSASHFILAYLPTQDQNCLTKYVNEYVDENLEGSSNHGIDDINRDQGEVGVGISGDKTTSLDSLSSDNQCLSSGGDKNSLESSRCNHSSRFSCFRTITALAPIARVGICSYSILEELVANYLSGSLEDDVLSSLSLLIEGKASSRDSVNFLGLLGIPSFEESNFPGSLRHPNIAPVLAMLKTSGHINLVLPKAPYTLENILHYSPNALKSEWHVRFLIYQIVSALAYMHGIGVAHGNVCPSSIMLTDSCWSWLCICDKSWLGFGLSTRDKECTDTAPAKIGCCIEDCPSQGPYADLKLSSSIDWHSDFNKWWRGEMSNFEYLLILNRLAGRRWGDHTFHTVMPWVIDFSMKPDKNSDVGWRDLSKSKWRLAKGDEQLDFTYSTSEIPHHVSDEFLSELAVCSYKARRLYQWTPDECIPEFYCDPQVFSSLHTGMTDLAIPSWAGSPEEFVKLHRDALESDRVSCQIHHWIDITFGYKMLGQAAVAAKNVMLPSSEPTMPRSVGRRQLFTRPHPMRRGSTKKACDSTSKSTMHQYQLNEVESEKSLLFETAYLQELEEASAFSEQARHLSALYGCDPKYFGKEVYPAGEPSGENFKRSISTLSDIVRNNRLPFDIDLSYLLEHIEVEGENSIVYQELLLWRQRSSCSRTSFENAAKDIFSVGCVLAELHLGKPLFDSTSLVMYLESGILPGLMQELPPHTKILVEACIQKDWIRRPSAKSLLDSPYFPMTAEMCAPYCLPLVVTPVSDTEAEWSYILLKEFIKCLTPKAVKALVLPAIQKILQASYSHLKVSILQDSFVREIWDRVGKQAYLETIHPLVISNLSVATHKSSAAAASVLLIGSSEELGVPVTIHQTILPLIHCFGKGLCADGIDVLVRIGGLLGETFIVKQLLPLLKHVVRTCIDASFVKKPEPVQSWSALVLIDCLMALDGLVAYLPREVVVKELINDRSYHHVMVLMHKNLEFPVLQVAATTLMAVCQRIGPDLTALHVLPQLKELFDELAFSQEIAEGSPLVRSVKVAKPKIDGEVQIESRMDLVLILYPAFASLLGIEKLRQCCATWLLLEQYLLRCHNWKWEYTGESSRSGSENIITKRPGFGRGSRSEYNPAKLLLNGVGWSIPQSQGVRGTKNLIPQKWIYEVQKRPVEMDASTSNLVKREPWFWFPSPAASWDGPDFLGRVGGLKDELPWKIRASVIHSVRAHHGALRSLAVCRDESTVFTAGIGPGFKGTVQKWELTRINCVSGYYGHEENLQVLNDICQTNFIMILGIILLPNHASLTDLQLLAELGNLLLFLLNPQWIPHILQALCLLLRKNNADQGNMLNSNTLSSGLLNSAFDGSLYTCMHHLEFVEKLVVGTGNGSLRFIDIAQGRKLHMWRGESVESGFPSLVSAICSCGSDTMQADGASASPSWIAAGLSTGHCRLFDSRSGNVIASWRAHDGYVTKLAAPEDHLLVSSSLDRTLRIWDLRRNLPPQPTIFKGHSDGVSGFSLWGQDVITISKNRIGLMSLSKSSDEDGHHRVTPQKLYMADHGTKNVSVLSSISELCTVGRSWEEGVSEFASKTLSDPVRHLYLTKLM